MKIRWRRARREGARFRYSAWDGTQTGFDFDADSLFAEMTDDLLYHGDLNAALRRLMQQGFTDADGNRLEGLREMLERLRDKRKEMLEQYDLGGVYDDIARELDEITDTEREALEEFAQDAADSGDERRADIAQSSATERNVQLDMLPPDLAGKMRGLQNYDFVSPEAREQFNELVERLRQEVAQKLFRPDDRRHGQHDARGPGSHQGHDGRAEPDARAAGPRRGARLRGLHGPLRRLLPREPAVAGRAARDHGQADGGHGVDAQLDDPRAAPAAGRPGLAVHGRHGLAVAGPAARPEPPAGVPRHGLGPQLPVRRRQPAVDVPGGRRDGPARRPRRAVGAAAGRREPLGAGRGGPRAGARAAGRPVRRGAGAAQRDGPDARGVRAGAAHRGPPGADAAGAAPDRAERAGRPVQPPHGRQDRQPSGPQERRRPRVRLRDQALRVRRLLQPEHRAHRAQRRRPPGRRHTGEPHARRLRD